MTSTNDGKDVKSNQTSGHKGKTYYIELYKSLEARLSGSGSLSARTGHLCDAWRRVYSLHQHSAHSTHPHLLSWLQRHTALTVLQTEWRDPKSKDEHAQLGAAIESLIAEVSAGAAARPAPLPWEQLLLQRAHWFRDVLENPWGHPVLERLLNPTGEPVTDEQVLEWLTMERGVVFVTRLRTLGAARDCSDLALTLAATVMERARAARPARDDQGHDTASAEEDGGPFAATLTREAGFSQDVWDLLVDIEFVLLHKRDKRARCIELAKQTPLRNGYQLVERLRSRPETSPRDKKLWKDAKEVATLIAQVIIARCMVVTSCTGASRSALYCCARSLARLVAPARLPGVTAVLAAPAATARHLHTLCSAMHAQCPEDMMPFVCELYVRAITAGMNELERLKDEKKQSEARQSEQTLASWFTQLGALLGGSARLKAECALTAFSVHPAHAMYERVRATPPLAPPADTFDLKPEGTSEFNSWANDSRSQSNLVKTSETLQLKQGPRQANVLSSAILTEGEALGLSIELGQDLVVLLAGPRVKTLLWDMDRELLLEKCRAYMERTHAGTRALTTELKYLNLDPQAFQHLPEEEDDETDAYYGIEKGYEHLVQVEEPEEIWQNAFIDPENTESAPESEIESYQLPIKKMNRASSEEEDDPLSIISDAKKEKKRADREKSKERRKKKSHKRDSSKGTSKERRKDKDKKPKKERKKKKSDQPAPGLLTSLLGMKVTEMPSQVQDGEKRVRKKKERRRDDVASRVSVTDSDYDSQGKLSQVSDTNEPDILIDVLSVDELTSSDIRKSDDSQKVMDNVSPAVGNDVAVLINPSITKAKKPVKNKKAPSVKIASDKSDASRARSPYLTPNKLPSRHVVSSKVRNSITKLLKFRRNKLKALSVAQQSTSARTHALVGMKICNPEVPKIHMTQKQCEKIEAVKNEAKNLLNVEDQAKSEQFVAKIPYNEAKEVGKLSGPQSVYNAETTQDMRYIQQNTTQNVEQNPNTFRENQKALSDYMLNKLQYNNYMMNKPPRPTSVIESSYISPSKQVDKQYAPHISPSKPSANRLTTQPFHKSMQNLTNNDDLQHDQNKKHINDVNYYNQYALTNPQHSPRFQNNACIKSPNVAQNQSSNVNSNSLQQHAAVVKAREDVIKFYHSVPDNVVRTYQSRAPQVNTQVSQSLNDDVIRHGQKQMSSLMQDTRTEKYVAGNVAKRLQTPNDSRSGHISHTKTYASSHTGEPNAQRNFNASDNKLQSQVGRIVQNPVKTSPIVRDATPKQLNVQAQQTPKLGIDNNFQEFLKELQKTINAGVNAKAGHSVALNKEVKVSLVNNTSMTASAKKNDLIPSSAKQLIQQKKTENAPNTFSRLSYMHKNKQSEIKLKNDALALDLELNKNIMEHKIRKAKYMKNEVIISRVDKKNTIVNDKVNMQTFPKTEQTSSHVQNDFPVLTSILDAKPLEKCKRRSRASSTVTRPTLDNSVNREHADLLLLLRNQQSFIEPKAKTNPSAFDHGPSSHRQPKVEKAQKPVATNRTYQRTDDKDIATSYLLGTKTNTDSAEAEDNQQDWKSVMNALKAHTTTPLGPKALDMVLKKERKHSPGSSSSLTSGTKTVCPNSSQSKATDSMRREHHISTSSSASQKSSIERHAEATKMPNQNEVIKKTPEVSKITEVPNKHFTLNPPKQDDPFISGILNSDYDLLEELMDDDLRQEIGELSSDEEYRAPAVPVKAKAPCIDSKRSANACAKLADVPKDKTQIVDLKTIVSNNMPDFKRMETNCTRTAVNTSSQASYTNVMTHHPVISNTSNLPESRPTVLCSNTNDQHTAMNVITNQAEHHHYIANIPSNTRMEPTNLIITSVPAQPMVLISQELVYDPYPTIRIHESQVNAGLCSITQNAYVAVNTAPNIAVYQTTQFAAPVINPVIIGNATTTTTNDTNVLRSPNGNQHVKHEEKPAIRNMTSPVAEDRIKDDSDKGLEKSINLSINKNNERKVLSQVQENHTNDVSDKDLRRLSVDRNPKTKQDEERLKMKRQSLMNREVKHPRHPPIPLSYTPLGKKVNVNKLLHGTPKNGTVKSNYEKITKIVADKKETVVTSVESPKAEANNENIENPGQTLSAKENNKMCRRILLRSSNTLENKLTPSKSVRIPLRRNKVKLKVAELAEKVAGSSDVEKNNDKTTNNKIARKRISQRLMDKKVKNETTEPNKVLSLETNKNQELSVKNIDSKEIPYLEFIDFEKELSGSKILKVPIPPKTKNAQQDLDKDTEEKAETQTVVENIREENNKKPAFLDNNKATPIRNTAVPTVLLEKLKHNVGDQLIKSTSVTKTYKEPIVMTIKNKNETVLSINTKEPSKQVVCDKSDNTIVKTGFETKATSKPPVVPALHIKLNSSGPVIINDNQLNVKTAQPESVLADDNKKNIKTTQPEPAVIDENKLKVTTTLPEPVIIDENKLRATTIQPEPVVVDDNKLKVKAQKSESAVTGHDILNVNIKQTEPVTVDNNKIKAKGKQPEPILSADDKVNAKIKPTELEMVDDNKINKNVKQSEPVIVSDDKLKEADAPAVVDVHKLKAAEKQCAPVVIVENNKSIINKVSSKDETSQQPENITENLDQPQRLLTKKKSINKEGSVPLPEKACDKATPKVATEVQNNNNTHFISVDENSSLTKQRATDVHSKKVTVNDSVLKVNNPEQHKNAELNQTPIVSDLSNNSKSVNENLLCHKKNDDAIEKDYNNQKASKSLKDNPTNGQNNVAQFRKEDYIIEEINSNVDPSKKCVRIKLPNGNAFKVTVFGKDCIDYDTLFAHPAMKKIFTQSLNGRKRYTLNINRVATTPKNNPNKLLGMKIHGINVIEKKIDTVIISDDEDDDTRSFSTEFGKYNTKIDMASFTKHQKKFVQKCVVKLSRDNIFKSNRTKPKPRSFPWTTNSLLTRTKSKLLSQEQNKTFIVPDVSPSNTNATAVNLQSTDQPINTQATNALLIRTKSNLLSQEQIKTSIVPDVSPSNTNATAVNLQSTDQPINTQATNALLTRTKSKLLSKEHNLLSCIIPKNSQPSTNSTKESLPAVNFKSSEQPIKQAVPTPLILKYATVDRNLSNDSEVIEIDDSSNDSIVISTNENVEPVKKIIELKSLLLQDLGVAGSENAPTKENVMVPGNIAAVENLKNALLKDFGVAETTKKLHDVDTEQKEGSKDNPIKTTVLLMKECLVKVSKCDDLVKKHNLIKRAKECFVLLQRCDVLPVKSDLNLNETPKEHETDESTLVCGEDFIDFDVEEDSIATKLSRCPSLSILNLWDDTICQPTTESLYGRSSPVMEIFEALSSLCSKCIHENVLEEKVQLLPITCCSEWAMTKLQCRIQEKKVYSHQQETKGEEIINPCDYNPMIFKENAVFIFKAPKLVTIALKILENPDVVYRLHVARDVRKKSLKSPSNYLKRKTETSDDKVASKILKLGTLTLNAINTYDGNFFCAKIDKSEEVDLALDVTQNVVNDRISSSPELITEVNKSTEGIQYKNHNSPVREIRHVNQDEESNTDSTEEKAERKEKMASKDTVETKPSEPTCVGQEFVSIVANDSNITLGIVANTEVENEIVKKESEDHSKTDKYEIQIRPEKTNKDCDLDISLNRENDYKTYSDLENKLASNDVISIHEHCTEVTSDDCNEVNIGSNGPLCTLQIKLNSGDEHSLTSKSTEEKAEQNEKMASKDSLEITLSEPTCVGQPFASIVANDSDVIIVANTEVENEIVKKESEEYSKRDNYEIQIQPEKTNKDCDLDITLNRENDYKTYSYLENKLASNDVISIHEHCTEVTSEDCNEVNIESNGPLCTLQMKLNSGDEHTLTSKSTEEKAEQNEKMASKDILETTLSEPTCVGQPFVSIVANDSYVTIVANTEVENEIVRKESDEYSKTENNEIQIQPEETNKNCGLDISLNLENDYKTYSDLENKLPSNDVTSIHEHCTEVTSDDCNEVNIESNGPLCTLQMKLNSGDEHSLTSKSTEEKAEQNEKMASKDILETTLSEPTCVGQPFVSIVANDSYVTIVANTEVENEIVRKESDEYSKTENNEIQIQPEETNKNCGLDISLNLENDYKPYSDLQNKLASNDVNLIHEHCTEDTSDDCNEVNIESNDPLCTLQMKLNSGDENSVTPKSTEESEKMASKNTLETMLSEPTCVDQAFVSIVANDSNVSLGIAANTEVEIVKKESEEYSKRDNYEIQIQPEKTNEDCDLNISLNRENDCKTYFDLENKLCSNDVTTIHEHCTEVTSDDCKEVNIESYDPLCTLQIKLNLGDNSLISKPTCVPSTSATDPAVATDPISENTDMEINSTVEDIINCLLQRCDYTEKTTNGVCQITEKRKGISLVVASDTDKYLSHDMASDVLKDTITMDDSKSAIDKIDAEEFENSIPCEDNIEKDFTDKEDLLVSTNSNIVQKSNIMKNQPDDTTLLLCQSSKEGDSELLALESKQAVTEIHYHNLETEEEIVKNYPNVHQTSDNALLCEISGDDIPKEGCEVEIVDTTCEEETEIVVNTNEVISCESATENHDSPITSPLVVDNKEIIFNYHDYIKPHKRKEIPPVNNEEHDSHCTPDQDSQVLTDGVTLKVSETNTSICDQLQNSTSPKIRTKENLDEEEPSNNDHMHTVASSNVKAKPEYKYEFIQEDDLLTVITTENEKDTTTADTEVTSSNLEVSTEDQDLVSPVSTEGSGVTLKGIEYEDPVLGKCYVFSLNESGSSTSNISSDNLEVFQESDSSQDASEFKDPYLYEDLHNIEFCVIIPKVTYSKGSLKRKKNMRDFNVLESKYRKNNERDRKIIEKRYRKGKNIDCPKQTLNSISDSAYAKEFNRLLEYYSSLKFSFARPFPKEYLDTSDMISNWPVSGTFTEIPTDDVGENLFDDLHPTQSYQPDPATQTLAEEITYQYEKTDSLQKNQPNQAPETNFNTGFGEGSGRVIQNLKKGGVSNISAATLSDVKQSQPFLVSEDYDYKTLKTNTDDQLKKIRQYVNFIELRDKVRSFFKKTSVELKSDWIQQNKSKHNDKLVRDFPFDLCGLDYVRPAPSEVVVQVVQVGQLPVSAAAQNPVTCDPRVTQVSDASPSQCSVDNSPNDDSQSEIKTEYTELTTADLTLPLVQEYAQQNQAMNQDSYDVNDIEITEQTISLEMEIKAEERPEIKQEMPDISEERSNSADNTDMQTYASTTPEHLEYSFENNPAKPDGNNVNYDAAEKNNSETFSQQRQQNGTSEKTDQIAHAMNAAGITTTPESINNSRAHALVNILSQKIRQGSVNTTQTTTNTYSKTTSINAMSLQQALAQILPPPLNQTGSSENNQTGSTPVGPQVLHIVQGKNASGNQITLLDNSQQSVISSPNATQVLHIVQNKGATSGQTSNGTLTSQSNTFSGLSLVDTGLQQGGNQLLHIVNTGNQKNASPGQLLKRVNLLTNLANVQGSNEQKMVQFVCKSADGKAIQLNAPHQRSMVLRLQPIETPNVQTPPTKLAESQDLSPSTTSSASSKEAANQQEIKSRSIYEENYAKFIQNSSSKTPSLEKSTSLPKFNQAFGKPVFQEGNQKQGEAANSNTHVQSVSTNNENTECHATDNAINLEHIGQISSPPLLLRKQPAVTSQSPSNLVQQIKQTISPMNIQTMHGGVIYTRQIPVNIGGGQTINLITVPSTELMNEDTPKQQSSNQGDIEPSIIKIVPQSQPTTNSEGSQEDNISHMNSSSENAQNPQPQPVLTQMRIKLPMLSKAPQMVPGARVVRPSFFQIQRNVIGGANQPVYQQLVLTAAPPLGQQTIRLPQAQASRPIKVASESQSSSSESQMSSSTLEQLREFDMVLEQVKERSTVQPSSNSNNNSFKLQTNSSDATDGTGSSNCSNESTQQQVFYSIGNNQSLNVAYVNRKATVTTPTTSTYVRSPDSTGIADSPTSSTHVQIPHTVTTDSSPTESSQPKPAKVGSKSKSRPKSSSNPPNTLKLNSASVPPKTSSQKPLEDEQTTQRILYILAEYKEQVENSPDKDKPAPRRRSNPPSNPGSSKRKKGSSSRRSGTRDMSPVHGEDTCRTMGSEDSSCGTSQGDCTESCLDSHSPQDSPRKVARKITFEQELPTQPRPQPQRNVIVADGQTITVARGATGKPATAVLMPANYILPVSMVKGGQQIAIVTNRGPKLLTVGGEGGAANALLLQRLIGPGGLKPVLARPGVRHVRLPTAALHNLQAFNLATGAPTSVQPPDSTASPTPGPTPPELVDTRATSSPWTDRDEVKPERGSSPEGSEPWNLPSSADPHEYSYEETVRTDNMDRTVLVVQKKDGSQRQHRLSHVSAAALRHKYAILEHELRLQKSLSEECEDLGVDSPSASELFPEAELLFATSPAHEHNQDQHHSHTPQPHQSTIPQPDMDDQIATDHLIPREVDVSLGLSDVGIVAVSEDGMQATIALDQEEFARSHPNTTFHSEPTDAEVQPFTITGLKGRHITSTIFHSNSVPATVLMAAPQATVISQAPESVKYGIENMINMPSSHNNEVNLSSVLVKDDGLTRFDGILTDSRELHLTNTTSAIVHSSGNATQVIRRVCYEDDKRERDTRFLIDEPDNLIAGDDAKMIAEDSSRDATLESMADVDDDRSSPERHAELFWESNSASERSESRRPLDFSSDSDKCCKSPSFDETNSTDSSGVGTHMRLDSVIKEARGRDRSGSADGSSADDTHPPLRTYPPKRLYHPLEGEVERSLSGKTRAGERSPDSLEVRRRASGRGVVKRGCHCCNGSPAPPRPKKPRQRKPTLDFNSTN